MEDSLHPVAKHIKRGVSIAAIVVVLTIGGCNSIYTVGQGERGIHTRMGALAGITQPGMRFKFPFIDGVQRMEIRSTPIEWKLNGKENTDSRMVSYSNDQQPAHIAITITWSLPGDEKTIASIFTKYGSRDGFYYAVVLPKTVEAVKNVFGTYTASTVIQQRGKFNADVQAALIDLLKDYPLEINGVQVQDIEFSDDYENAVEARMMAQVAVQKKEQEKQQTQLDADMTVIKAEANAKMIRLNGDAEADAIRARGNALAQSPKLVELTAAERWNGVLPTMMPGQTLPFITVK